ncbi:ankyrin repeat and protein kinase domain-containing protein 1-like [Montipora capricornis]|uniref:ankyrin repeat and protein kinase domain-containing protein 1-like n=1 Tax=Montipora capricornis TaxID=246305 RepID=UPI0035F20C20
MEMEQEHGFDVAIATFRRNINVRGNAVDEFLEAVRDGRHLHAKVFIAANRVDPNLWLGQQRETALHVAAENGHSEFCEFLLEIGADKDQKDVRVKIPLHLAAAGGHLDVVRLLVEAGSNLDNIDKFGKQPLMYAVAGAHVETVKFLLETGSSVTSGRNWHALHEACKVGSPELVQILIDAGARVNNPRHYSGGAPWSPLHIAVRHGNLDCIKLLIKAGADVNSINAGRHTPLHEAAYRGYENVIQELLLHGADPHAASNQRRTPLHEACMQGNVQSAMMLLDVGSKVNARDFVTDTPLHLALRANHACDIATQLTCVLLRYGASSTLMGRDDEMPLDIAKQSSQDYSLELLESALEIPQPLVNICKVSVRKQLACHWDRISELPLPVTLKTFVTSVA